MAAMATRYEVTIQEPQASERSKSLSSSGSATAIMVELSGASMVPRATGTSTIPPESGRRSASAFKPLPPTDQASANDLSSEERRDAGTTALAFVLREDTDDTLVAVHLDGLTVLYGCRCHGCTYHGGDAILAGDYGAVTQDAAGVGDH